MKPKSKKTKGKKFEQQVANIIHNHFYEYNREYRNLYDDIGDDRLKPKRDFSSGTFKDSQGDIDLSILKKFFPFSIEVKHHKNLNFSLNSILTYKLSRLDDIWNKQVIPKSEETGLKPLLVFKANYTDIFCMCRKEDINLENVLIFINLDDKVIVRFDTFLFEYEV